MATHTKGAKKPKLTIKQAKLVKGIAEGKPKIVAAVEAGYGNSPGSANSIAHETLQNPTVREALDAALERQGITLDAVIKPVGDALRHDELEMQLKGHDRAAKLMGLNRYDNPVSVNFMQLNQGERDYFSTDND